jgi:PadR family transcriptional regulator, regulatory protein PadR
MRREQPKGHLDLRLLSVLAGGSAHGYVIIGALRERSDGAFDLPEGTIYPALHRLEKNGLLRSYWAERATAVILLIDHSPRLRSSSPT